MDEQSGESAMRHSLQFAFNKIILEIFGALSKDMYKNICKYFGIWTVEEQISTRKSKFNFKILRIGKRCMSRNLQIEAVVKYDILQLKFFCCVCS